LSKRQPGSLGSPAPAPASQVFAPTTPFPPASSAFGPGTPPAWPSAAPASSAPAQPQPTAAGQVTPDPSGEGTIPLQSQNSTAASAGADASVPPKSDIFIDQQGTIHSRRPDDKPAA
jgi:hypothetical protein